MRQRHRPANRSNVDGNLKIESLQDTSKYDSQQKFIGGCLSVVLDTGKVSGSLSVSPDKCTPIPPPSTNEAVYELVAADIGSEAISSM